MQESKMSHKSLWWNGASGGMTCDGDYKIFWVKPPLVSIPNDYMEIYYNPHLTHPDANMYVRNGQKVTLTDENKAALDAIITAAFATGGGGGGGSSDDAIVSLMSDGVNPNLVFQRGDGSMGSVNLKPAIQNTPAHNMGIQVKSEGLAWWADNISGAVTPPRGIPAVNPETIHYPPPSLWNMEGSKRDADYNKDDGSFEILANNVEVSFMTTMSAGMDWESAHFHKGIPTGDFGFSVVIDYSGDSGKTWERVTEQQVWSMTGNNQYPNTQTPCISVKNRGFKFNAVKAGRYRVGYKLLMGNMPSLYPEFRMFYSCWESESSQQPYYHQQMTGTIKNVSTPEVIPPHS